MLVVGGWRGWEWEGGAVTGKAAAVCDVFVGNLRRNAPTRPPSRRLLSRYANEPTRILYSSPSPPFFFYFFARRGAISC